MSSIYDNKKKVMNRELQQVFDRQGKKDIIFQVSPIQDTEIPKFVFVQCPVANMLKVQACKHCTNCIYFRGIQDNGERPNEPPDTVVQGWASRYFLICAAPMTRKCEVFIL